MTFYEKKIRVTSRPINYGANGTGRDSYISTINGGFYTQDKLHSLAQPKPLPERSMNFQTKQYHRSLPPKKDAKNVNYHSDGSGRDFYVGVNNGGAQDTSYHWRNHVDTKFNNSLRYYDVIEHSFQRDLWRNLQQGYRNQKNPRQLSAERSTRNDQMNLTARLSTANPLEKRLRSSSTYRSPTKEGNSVWMFNPQYLEDTQKSELGTVKYDSTFHHSK